MANEKPKNNITRGYRSTNNKVIEGWTGGEGPRQPSYSSNKRTILFGYFATNRNGKVPEGWKGGQGTHIPPPYVGPKSSFTRAYYSPNTKAYELGWRRGPIVGYVDYFKNAIALATILVNNQTSSGKNRKALVTSSNLASTSKSYIQFKLAVALQTSAIVSRYVRSKIKTAIVNYVGIITNSKSSSKTRLALATTAGYATFTGISKHFRVSVVNLVNIAFEGRVDAFFRKAIAAYTQSVTTFKTSKFTRTAKALQTSLVASVSPLGQYYRKAVANTISLINSNKITRNLKISVVNLVSLVLEGRLDRFFRYATAAYTQSINVFKQSNFARTGQALQISLTAIIKPFDQYYRNAITNIIGLVDSNKITKSFKISVVNLVNVVFEGRIDAFFRYAVATYAQSIETIKNSKFARIAKTLQVSLATSKIPFNQYYRNAIAAVTGLINSSKTFIRVKQGSAINANLTDSYKAINRAKQALANIVFLAQFGKGFQKNSSVIAIGLSTTIRGISKTSKVIFTLLAFDGRVGRFFKNANATQSVLATVTKQSDHIRNGSVTVTYEISNIKFYTYLRIAIANSILLVKSTKARVALINSVFINIASYEQISQFKRTAQVIVTNLSFDGRINDFFKKSIASITYFITTTKQSKFIRIAETIQTNFAITSKFATKNRVTTVNSASLIASSRVYGAKVYAIVANIANNNKVGNFVRTSSTIVINLTNTIKNATFIRVANVIATNIASDSKIDQLYRYVIAMATSLITTTKQSRFVRIAQANQIGIAIATRLVDAKRVANVNLIMLSSVSKNYGKNIQIVLSNLIKTTKVGNLTRQATTIFTNAIDSAKFSRFIRVANALAINIASDSKIDQFYRYAIATATNIITTVKQSKFIRIAETIQANLAIASKFATKDRVATVNIVSLIASSRTYGARVSALAVNITNNSKVGRFVRVASATVINLTIASKLGRFFKTAIAMVTNIAKDGKIDRFYRYAIARATNLVITTKQSRFIRVSKATQVGIAIATRVVVAKRLATANRAMLVKVSKNYGKNIKVVFANLVRTTKIARFTRQGTAAVTNLATTRKLSRFIRIAKVTATNIAKDGKIDRFYRYAIARTTGLIKTTKLSRFNRNANVNRISLARTNKRRATFIKALSTNLSANTKSHAYRKIAKNIVIFIGKAVNGGKVTYKNASVLQSVSATVTKANNRKKYATATISYQIGTTKGRTYLRKAIATTIGLVRYGLSLVMNVRSVESAKVQPINAVDFYVTPNNPDLVGEYTSENDQPGDYSEPVNNLGEDVVPT